MKNILLVLSFLILTACRPTSANKPQEPTEPIVDTIVESESSEIPAVKDIEKLHIKEPMKVLWVHRALSGQLAHEIDCPILFFVYHNEFEPSIGMDMITFAHPDVAGYINQNFVSMRADYREMDGRFAPGTLMVLNENGEILITSIGYIPPEEILLFLEEAKMLNERLYEVEHGEPKEKKQGGGKRKGSTWFPI